MESASYTLRKNKILFQPFSEEDTIKSKSFLDSLFLDDLFVLSECYLMFDKDILIQSYWKFDVPGKMDDSQIIHLTPSGLTKDLKKIEIQEVEHNQIIHLKNQDNDIELNFLKNEESTSKYSELIKFFTNHKNFNNIKGVFLVVVSETGYLGLNMNQR
jgi:hypothetical protein